MNDLFRKEAVTYATRRLAGEVVLATPLSFRIIAGLGVIVIASALLFVATASYARKETVVGWLAPDAGLIRLTARQGGIVEALHVEEGAEVKLGQRIATLRLSSAIEGGDAYVALSESLTTQTSAAEEQAQAARAMLGAEERQLAARLLALERELAEARRGVALQDRRVDLANAEVERAETIAAQGYLPRRELDARRSAALAADQELSGLAASALLFEREIGEVRARLSAIPIDMRAAAAEAQAAGAGLDQQRTQTEAQSTYVVVATVAGRVVALPSQIGQTVAAGSAVGVITPKDSVLQAELYAPSRAAGFVREGQEVRLMYQAFPHQKFGTGEGQVSSVSRTVLAPSEISIPGLELEEPVFRVRVTLARESVSAYGQTLPLQPGMLLSADVIIDRRSLLEWLLDPLYAAGRRA